MSLIVGKLCRLGEMVRSVGLCNVDCMKPAAFEA